MKLSKTARIILGIGIFIIAFGSLYMVYSQQASEQEQLDDNLLAAQATLPKLVSEKEGWERQLTQLQSELAQTTSLLARTKTSFPKSVESIEYDEELFKIADSWGLEITRLTTAEPRDEIVKGINFSVTTFEVEVRGKVDDILDFVNTIVTHKDFATATVKLVGISVPESLTTKEKGELTQEEIEEKEKPSATIRLLIYGYRGE